MFRGVSLANKCTLLFGGAIVLIVIASLVAPWFRMLALIDAGQLDLSQQMTQTWLRLGPVLPAGVAANSSEGVGLRQERGGVSAVQLTLAQADKIAAGDTFLAKALQEFRDQPSLNDLQRARWGGPWIGTSREYRYVLALRDGPRLDGVVVLERPSLEATRLLILNTAFLLGAGAVVLAVAMLAFYLITRRLILTPLQQLTITAERVREGNLAIRSDIRTGDEFEELAETFNVMLTDLQNSQDRLRSINAALDLKLHELAESNIALHQAAKLKGEFLANVSHELRTPLNSIIGFAELLSEIAKADALPYLTAPGGHADIPAPLSKRTRYVENILIAARNLLALINSLLEMARIEAGKIDLRIERMNLRDACEGLLGLIAPLAAKKNVQLSLEVADDLPVVQTDAKKFQQIIFNFLSNAVKFTESEERTGRPPTVTLRVERLVGGAGLTAFLPASFTPAVPPNPLSNNPTSPTPPVTPDERVRVSVIDNGRGIPRDEQEKVFEKFYQLDASHTRENPGTGLGLAISKELAGLLNAEIQLVSEIGRGSMFSLIMPLNIDAATVEPRPAAVVST